MVTTALGRAAGAAGRRVVAARRRALAALRRTDRRRWARSDSLLDGWAARTGLLLASVPPGATVVDVGAGAQAARSMLPDGCGYVPVDVVARTPDTVVCDLNGVLPDLRGDFVLASGVVEYVRDPARLLAWFAEVAPRGALSYAVADRTPDVAARRAHGWLSDLTEAELVSLVAAAGLAVGPRDEWADQVLFTFGRATEDRRE